MIIADATVLQICDVERFIKKLYVCEPKAKHEKKNKKIIYPYECTSEKIPRRPNLSNERKKRYKNALLPLK